MPSPDQSLDGLICWAQRMARHRPRGSPVRAIVLRFDPRTDLAKDRALAMVAGTPEWCRMVYGACRVTCVAPTPASLMALHDGWERTRPLIARAWWKRRS
jgi:hypothetical protein